VNDPYLFLFNDTHVLVPKDSTTLPRRSAFPVNADFIADDTFSGTQGGLDYVCAGTVAELDRPPKGYDYLAIRSLFATLPAAHASLIAHATHISRWRQNNRFCGRCGAATIDDAGEAARKCTNCGYLAFPRISPAIIVGVVRDNTLLLARNKRYATPMFSIIAGFVEPGESLEQTVEREIHEEVSLNVRNIRYFGSQPWPFPDSLMIGFLADYDSGAIQVDGEEIVEADWYSPDSFPPIPPHGSISRRIIDWFTHRHESPN
jgi:NAD+ diphosphatase